MNLKKIAWRNVRRNTRRSLLSMTAIAVAAMILVFMFSMIGGMKNDMRNNMFTYTTGQVRIRNAEYDEKADMSPLSLSVNDIYNLSEKVNDMEEVRAVSPRITFGTAIYRDGKNFKALGCGVDMEREIVFQPLEKAVVDGRLPVNGEKEVLISAGLAESLDLKTGDKFTIYTKTKHRSTNGRTLKVTGIAVFPITQLNGQFFLAPLDQIQKLLKMPDEGVEMLISLGEGVSEDKFMTSISELLKKEKRSDLKGSLWKDVESSYTFIIFAEKMYDIIALLFFLLGSTVIINTTMMVIFERMKEIGTLSAMGMSGAQLIKLFFLEAMFLSIIGSLAGVLIGIGITWPFTITGINFGEAMEGIDFDMSSILTPVINFKSTVFVFVYSVAVASISSFFPSIKVSRVDPVKALRS